MIALFAFTAHQLVSQTPSWSSGTGMLYTQPLTTKVGIGTNNTDEPASLTIKVQNSLVGADPEDGSPSFRFIRMQMQLGATSPNNWDWVATNGYHLTLRYNNQVRFMFANDGRMGIKTGVVPNRTLAVKGNCRFIKDVNPTSLEINGNEINLIGTSEHLHLLSNNSIGTNKLLIRGVTEILQPGNTNNFIRIQHDGVNARIDGLGAGELLVNYGNPTQRVVFEPDVKIVSKLMVGTNFHTDGSDIYRLSVDGKIRAKEVKCYTTWADFVFEPNYKLMPLKEVQTYTQQYKHLLT